MHIAAEFYELNILLFRTVIVDGKKQPLKVAKISLHELKLSTLVAEKQASGSMRSLIVNDLTRSSLPHKCIFNLGDFNKDSSIESEIKAIKFHYQIMELTKKLNLQIASAYYLHNQQFLNEISLCAGDYKQYALNLAVSLQIAASDMAKTIVVRRKHANSIKGQDELFPADDYNLAHMKEKNQLFLLDACIQTPVVMLPNNDSGLDLLIAYLGQINVSNCYMPDKGVVLNNSETAGYDIDRLTVEIKKVNCSSLTLSSDIIDKINFGQTQLSEILHRCPQMQLVHNTDLFLQIDQYNSTSDKVQRFDVQAKVNSPLKLFLSLPIYKQILSTLAFCSKLSKDSPPPSASSSFANLDSVLNEKTR